MELELLKTAAFCSSEHSLVFAVFSLIPCFQQTQGHILWLHIILIDNSICVLYSFIWLTTITCSSYSCADTCSYNYDMHSSEENIEQVTLSD